MTEPSVTPVDRGFRLHAVCELPRPVDEVFAFFADARNLERLTPPFLNFEVLTPDPIDMREGALIDYRLRVRGLPLRWQSRISVWEPPHRFVDEQLKGPYKKWHHEHLFSPGSSPGSTRCEDIVHYAVPLSFIVHSLFVGPDVKRIFRYRQEQLKALFP